jgi:signal transduction histidine kinase
MLSRKLRKGSEQRRLRLLLSLFFAALVLPTGVLVQQAYSQLKWEAFHQQRQNAEVIVSQIDRRLVKLIEAEESRSFADYSFLVLAGAPAANFLQRSRLSDYPLSSGIPGLMGYFQIDADGVFSTPLLPAQGEQANAYGIADNDYQQRLALQNQLRDVLSQNQLVRRQPARLSSKKTADQLPADAPQIATEQVDSSEMDFAGGGSVATASERFDDKVTLEETPTVVGQSAFDELKKSAARRPQAMAQTSSTLGKVSDLQLDQKLETQSRNLELARQPAPGASEVLGEKRGKRREQGYFAETPSKVLTEGLADPATVSDSSPLPVRIDTFDSEIDPFEFSLLDSGQFVLFRKVWRNGQRFIQGALIQQQPFLAGTIENPFRESALASNSSLIIANSGDVLKAISGPSTSDYLSSSRELSGSLLYQTRLSAPLGEMELIFSITQLPAAPGSQLLGWLAVILVIVLCGGFAGMYRLGLRQIQLARQQQDFVAAVSHELKTPLTSIRMYGEMLREGWADEAKKQSYYEFIYAESERLSRLIANVLQLASLSRNQLQLDLKPISIAALVDLIKSKVANQIERGGYRLDLDLAPEASELELMVDSDCFAQVLINLVDNAIKFSAKAEKKVIEIRVRPRSGGGAVFSVRDFGPGVQKSQMKKIFLLFYRSEGELTRETVGTGIGLALVHRLTLAMGGKVDVRNREPGAEFQLKFG